MLCSGEELGIDDDWFEGAGVYGILILPEDTVPGTDVKQVLGLDDEVWDISITANLPHCQSVFGIARELAAKLTHYGQYSRFDGSETFDAAFYELHLKGDEAYVY